MLTSYETRVINTFIHNIHQLLMQDYSNSKLSKDFIESLDTSFIQLLKELTPDNTDHCLERLKELREKAVDDQRQYHIKYYELFLQCIRSIVRHQHTLFSMTIPELITNIKEILQMQQSTAIHMVFHGNLLPNEFKVNLDNLFNILNRVSDVMLSALKKHSESLYEHPKSIQFWQHASPKKTDISVPEKIFSHYRNVK